MKSFVSSKPVSLTTRRAGQTGPAWRWRNFSRAEMACRCCGQVYNWPEFMDRLQYARTQMDAPFTVLSGHRCSYHNANVGGAPLSQHLKLAADIALSGHDPIILYRTCQNAGFSGFGFYKTFLHIDLGRPRQWYGSQQARDLWQILSE